MPTLMNEDFQMEYGFEGSTSYDEFSYADLDLVKFRLDTFNKFDRRIGKIYNNIVIELPSDSEHVEINFKGKTYTYVLDDIFDTDAKERKRLFKSLKLSIGISKTNIKVDAELWTKPTKITIEDSAF